MIKDEDREVSGSEAGEGVYSQLYVMKLAVWSRNGLIPREVCEDIRHALRSVIGHAYDFIDLEDFDEDEGNRMCIIYEDSIKPGETVHDYFKPVADAVRAVPGCEKDGEHKIVIEAGYDDIPQFNFTPVKGL